MKWLKKTINKLIPPPLQPEDPAPKPNLPKYYSKIVKGDFGPGYQSIVPGIGFFSYGGTSSYFVKANIIDRDTGKVVNAASGYFDALEKYKEGLDALQKDIEKTIKYLYEKDRLKAELSELLVQTDIINNGLEWFYK